MKKIILIFTVLAFTCFSSECLAQKVLKDQTINAVAVAVIDNATLPVGAIKTKSVLATEKDNTTGQMDSHNETDVINEKVSPRFAVAKTDVKKDGTSESETMTWSKALAACAAYKEGDDKANVWRLPTQRELMLIYQMKAELEVSNGFTTFTANYYWSSTEISYNSYYSWFVYFGSGSVGSSSKDDDANVRCVRDL